MEETSLVFREYLRYIMDDTYYEKQIPSIVNAFKKIELNKNNFFVKEGSVCNYFCFIEKGILQHSIDVLGEEKTTYLALKNTATSALKSFKNNSPSRKNIKALSNCDLWVINLEGFNELLKNNEAFKKFYYNLIENQIFLIDDYRIDLLTRTPEERYLKFLQHDPNLLQFVSLPCLASFLGISTRHLSRIRKKMN